MNLQDNLSHIIKRLDDVNCARVTVFTDASDNQIAEATASFVNAGYWFIVRNAPQAPGIRGVSCSKTDWYKCGINPYFAHIHGAS